MFRKSRFFFEKIRILISIFIFSVILGCSMPNFVNHFRHEMQMPAPIVSRDWKEIDISQNRFFISDDFMNKIVYERVGANGLIAFSVRLRNFLEDVKFDTELIQIYRKLLLPPHNDLRVHSSGKFVSFQVAVLKNNNNYYQRAEFFLKGKMGLKLDSGKKKEREEQLHSMESFSGPYTQKELKRSRVLRNELLNSVDARKCKVKVVVYLYETKILKFLYINIPRYYEKDLEIFDSFERSFSENFSSQIQTLGR